MPGKNLSHKMFLQTIPISLLSVMVEFKREKKRNQSIKLRCLKCDHHCVGELMPNGDVVSCHLSWHLCTGSSCMAHCTAFVPQQCESNKRKIDFDYRNSVDADLMHCVESKITSKAASFSPADFALTGTNNGPCEPESLELAPSSSDPDVASLDNLNCQTLYHGNAPVVCRENIANALNITNIPTSQSHGQVDTMKLSEVNLTDDVHPSEEVDKVDPIYVGVNPSNIHPISHKLTAEVELMNLLRKFCAPFAPSSLFLSGPFGA